MVRLFCSQPLILLQWIVPTIAKLNKMPLKPARKDKDTFCWRYLSFVLLYFDFWTISVHGSFDDSSYFVHVNINIFIWHILRLGRLCVHQTLRRFLKFIWEVLVTCTPILMHHGNSVLAAMFYKKIASILIFPHSIVIFHLI